MNKPRNNLVGKHFNELEVLELADFRLQKQFVYKCKCSCGKICYVRSNRLTSSTTKSCGHLKNKRHNTARVDFKGQQVDDFIIDEYSHNDKTSRYAIWECHCVHCGEIRMIASNQLRGHFTTKCTCRKRNLERET